MGREVVLTDYEVQRFASSFPQSENRTDVCVSCKAAFYSAVGFQRPSRSCSWPCFLTDLPLAVHSQPRADLMQHLAHVMGWKYFVLWSPSGLGVNSACIIYKLVIVGKELTS